MITHLAIIPDGNRRWARERGLPEGAGHAQAPTVLLRIVDWCIDKQIKYLTIYCFSSDNWKRSSEERANLNAIAIQFFTDFTDWFLKNNIRFVAQGDRAGFNKFSEELQSCIYQIEEKTKNCSSLTVFCLLNYSGQQELINTISQGQTPADLRPPVDVIVRTGKEKRLSNFLPWEACYAELIFRDEYFPDIDYFILEDIYQEYESRDKRYGK